MNSDVLRVEEVRKEFDDVVAVAGASFDVKRGEIFGLLGPNGAGKTTLIRMILGIMKPDQGSITTQLNGAASALLKEHVGYLPEERGLYEERRVGETLLYFADLHKMNLDRARERIYYWLDRLSLEGRFSSRLKELSKGMQQKVQFIAAVLHEPDLVVLDEPFSGLDPPSQDLFTDVIREMAAEGMTVMLSSHQMNLVENLCDRVFLINRGDQVLYGNLSEMKTDHGEDVVWMKFSDPASLDFQNLLIGQLGVRIEQWDDASAELILPKGVHPSQFLHLLVSHAEVEEISIAKPSLHRIFVDIVGREQ